MSVRMNAAANSSRSLTVKLRLEFASGETAECVYERYFDEDEEKSLTFGEQTVYIGDGTYCYWLMNEELGLGIGELDLAKLLDGRSPEELIRNLEAVFLIGTGEENEEEDGWEPELRAAEELARLKERKAAMADAYHAALEKNIRTVEDIRGASLRLEMDHHIPGPRQWMLQHLYGVENARLIGELIDGGGPEEQLCSRLRSMDCLARVNSASLLRLIRCLKKNRFMPFEYTVVQTLERDGSISLTFP